MAEKTKKAVILLAEDDPALCQVRAPEPELETGLWLLTHEDLATTGRVRVFLDFLADAIGRFWRRGSTQR